MTEHMNSNSASHIVVGVTPGQPATIIETAAQFARNFTAELVCAYVDPERYSLHCGDGHVVSMPIDPDSGDEREEEFDPEMLRRISANLGPTEVSWSVRALAGGPATELGRLGNLLDARMIVVGTHEPGVRGTLHEFFNGSIATHLAHHQHRPVVVVPLSPVGASASEGTRYDR